jgi:hypothetical protein
MSVVPPDEMSTVYEEMKGADKELAGGVFSHLERMANHKFGPLRAWPKWKTLKMVWMSEEAKEEDREMKKKEKNEKEDKEDCAAKSEERIEQDIWPPEWEVLRWRPLVSYAGHHWKTALSKAGKWCTHVVRKLAYGQHQDDPRMITEAVHQFNRGLRTGKSVEKKEEERRKEDGDDGQLIGERRRGHRRKRVTKSERRKRQGRRAFEDRELDVILRDIGSFFTKVPWDVFLTALRGAQEELKEEAKKKNDDWSWF